MVYYLDPKWIIVEFLRSRVNDPRDRIPDTGTHSETLSGTQVVQLSLPGINKLQWVNSVTVDGVTQEKWVDYQIDLAKERIIFTSPVTGAVVVNFACGTKNWIYPDKPQKKLSVDSFPRISVRVISAPGTRLGNYQAPMQSLIQFQVDVWTKPKMNGVTSKENQIFTITLDNDPDGNTVTRAMVGEDLANYLSYEVTRALRTYEDDLHPCLYNYVSINDPRDVDFDLTFQTFHKIVEFTMNGLNTGYV